MTSFDFDGWRASYNTMSFADQQASHTDFYREYPEQLCFDGRAVFDALMFLHTYKFNGRPLRVLEVGGWRGELAARVRGEMFTRPPSVEYWHNYDICRPAVEDPACKRGAAYEWYRPVLLYDYIWNYDRSLFTAGRYDVVVLSHLIEHLKWHDVRALFSVLSDVPCLVVDAPILDDAVDFDWTGYLGTHILEVGWKQVLDFLYERWGYGIIGRHRSKMSNVGSWIYVLCS